MRSRSSRWPWSLLDFVALDVGPHPGPGGGGGARGGTAGREQERPPAAAVTQ